MKNRIVTNYTFNKTAKTVTSFEFTSLEHIVMIVNQTTGTIIYAPNNVATNGTLSNFVLTLTYDTSAMANTDKLIIYVNKPHTDWKWSFAKVVAANGVDTAFGGLVGTVGTGMAISQSAGNLVITTGTTAFSETIVRSNNAFDDDMILRYGLSLSQRIANNNFAVELTDIVGDGLTMTIASTTSVTVTKTAHGFTSSDIGKGLWIGMSSVASVPTQRGTIASITDANNFVLTVAGFPATGTGTCSVWGYNYHQFIYNGVTATAFGGGYNSQRLGWQTAHGSSTIVTTASGHIVTLNAVTPQTAEVYDTALIASTTAATHRLTAPQNVPDNVGLYLQIRAYNGITAPASTTTMTMGFVTISSQESQKVSVTGSTPFSGNNPIAATIVNTPAVTVASTTLTAMTAGIVTNAIPTAVADVASAAIITTTTTSAFTPTFGSGYQVVIPVTVVSGTTPTMSVRIEESDDAGTNWYARYTFPTITATGIYRSPILRLRGNRVRYVQTITGTTPSFTRAINRNQRQDDIYSGYQGKLVSAASTNATSVLAAPCEVTKLTASNTNAAVRYLKIYDKASAPTVGTDIPVATYVIPGATTGGGTNIPLVIPDSFQLGFAFALTTGATDADTGAVAANELIVNYSIA